MKKLTYSLLLLIVPTIFAFISCSPCEQNSSDNTISSTPERQTPDIFNDMTPYNITIGARLNGDGFLGEYVIIDYGDSVYTLLYNNGVLPIYIKAKNISKLFYKIKIDLNQGEYNDNFVEAYTKDIFRNKEIEEEPYTKETPTEEVIEEKEYENQNTF